MEMTKMKDTPKRFFNKQNGPNTLLGIAGWVSLIFGVVLFSLGLWTNFHTEGGPLTASYRDDTVYVEAMYGKEARIPEDAELRAWLMTPEEDPEAYSQNMAAAMTAMGRDGEAVPTNAIYNVGFYVGDQEVEPAAPVNVTVQVLKDGFAAGEPIKVIHLVEDGAEVIADTSVDDAGFISFMTDGFSDFVIMSYGNGEEPGIALTSLNGNEGNGDMTGLLDEVTIADQKGETVTDGKLFVGEKYNIHLKFQEKGAQSGDAGQFSWTDDRKMTYQIPKNFKVSPRENQPLTVNIDGTPVEIGTFSIDENGLLTVQLTEEGKQKLEASTDIAISFDMDATAQKMEGGSDEDVHFGDTGKDFGFKVTDQPQITVDKKSTYDSENHTLKYTVSTKVDHGPVHDVVVSDILTPPNSKGITLEMMNGGDGKPEIQVTVIHDGETIELTEDDYELVPAGPDPAYPGKQVFRVKLKETCAYNPLKTDDELQVTYQYQAEFDKRAADVYWGQVVNEATVTGSFPMKDPETGGETKIPVEEKRGSYAEVYWDTDGNGVVSKDEAYSEATGKLHYTLYAAVAAGDYSPFYINDQATVEYNSRTWIVQGFDATHCQNLEVYASITDLPTEGIPSGVGEKQKLTGYDYRGDYTGYFSKNMNNYIYWMSDDENQEATDLYIFFGMNTEYDQGHWDYDSDRLITVEYDLDVSNGLTLYDKNTGETITLTKEQVLLAGVTNTVHLRYGHFYPGYSVFFSNGEKLNKYGRLDKLNNTIDYTVSLNLADTTVWEYLMDVAGDRSLEHVWGKITSAAFFDDYADGWEYVDGSLKATLYPKNGAPYVYTYNPDGLASYAGHISDDFSHGNITAYLWNFMNEYKSPLPEAFTAKDGAMADRLEFTYTLKASDEWLKENAYSESDTNVHNAAQILDDTMIHWDAEANVPYFPNRLTKTATREDTSNLITFTLEINTVGANLDPAKDYLIVTDDSTGIQIKPDSIKVTGKDGNELKGIGDTTIDAPLKDDEWGLLPTEMEGQYKLKIPDEKALQITYDALITAMGDNVTVSNKASIDGVGRTDSSYEESLKVDKVHAGGEGSTHQLTIVKTDSKQTSKKLDGAKFKFYIVRGGTSGLDETKKITVGDKKYSCHSENEWEFTTKDGQYTINGWNLEPGNYYILEELDAPEGYNELKDPILFYYGLKGSTIEIDSNVAEIVPPDGMLTVKDPPIEYNLPETGGPGTFFYVVTGFALVLGSGILLIFRKRLRQAQ